MISFDSLRRMPLNKVNGEERKPKDRSITSKHNSPIQDLHRLVYNVMLKMDESVVETYINNEPCAEKNMIRM